MSGAGELTKASATAAGKPAVFLSYAREDQAPARQVIALLESAGLTVWWDELLEGGVNYLPATEQALETASCVVVLWSRISVDSYWVRDEAQSGRERDCLVPLSLDGSLPPLGFRQFQVIDVSRWNGDPASAEAGRIRRAVLARCGCADDPVSAPPPARAVEPGVVRHGFDRRTAIGLGVGAGVLAAGGAVAWLGGAFEGDSAASNSIAVMPFRNVSGDADGKVFSEGLSNEVRVVLARNPRLKVTAPASSATIADDSDQALALARKLGMANLLRGSVQRAGDAVRVAAELVGTEDAVVVWAQSFDRKLADVFAVQSDIAEKVALALVSQVAGDEAASRSVDAQRAVGGTKSVAAYDAYLRGHALYDVSSSEATDRAALAQFEAAIREDPEYASAHAMRATMLSALATHSSEVGAFGRLFGEAIAAANKAIELAPKLALGHTALGYALSNGRLDLRAARPHYARAGELAAGDAEMLRSIASFLAFDEQGTEAERIIKRVVELDPLNARAFRTAGNVAIAARDYGLTIRRSEQAIRLNPEIAIAWYTVGLARYLQGDFAGALAAMEREADGLFANLGRVIAKDKLGDAAGSDEEMRAMIVEYGDNALYQQAQAHAQRGETALALDRLDRAGKSLDPGMLLARTDPLLDPLRREASFSRLLSVVRA